MAHEFILTKISNDFKKAIDLDENELVNELDKHPDFRMNKEDVNFYSIEVNIKSKWKNLIWYSHKNKRLSQNSKYFFGEPKMLEPLIKFADIFDTIIFGDEAELYFIPGIGQIQKGNFFNQNVITVMELAESNLKMDDKEGIRNYIESKSSSM